MDHQAGGDLALGGDGDQRVELDRRRRKPRQPCSAVVSSGPAAGDRQELQHAKVLARLLLHQPEGGGHGHPARGLDPFSGRATHRLREGVEAQDPRVVHQGDDHAHRCILRPLRGADQALLRIPFGDLVMAGGGTPAHLLLEGRAFLGGDQVAETQGDNLRVVPQGPACELFELLLGEAGCGLDEITQRRQYRLVGQQTVADVPGHGPAGLLKSALRLLLFPSGSAIEGHDGEPQGQQHGAQGMAPSVAPQGVLAVEQ